MRKVATFDMLYNQALLDISRTLQQQGYMCRSAWYARKQGESSMLLQMNITVRVRATRLLYDTLMLIVSKEITPENVLAQANQAAACRALKLNAEEFKELLQAGMPRVMDCKRDKYFPKLVAHGVAEQTAKDLVAYIFQQRLAVIDHLNNTDFLGCDTLPTLELPAP